ncbi:MAG: integrin alpha [Acidobacteriota bacterium]
MSARIGRLLSVAQLAALLLASCVASIGDAMTAVQVIDLSIAPGAPRFLAEDSRDRFGTFYASCDVDGDGLRDLVVGASEADGVNNTEPLIGEVFIVRGARRVWTGNLPIASNHWVRIVGEEPFDGLGVRVACGDINGDGFGDVVIGTPSGDGPGNSRVSAGQLHLVFGSPTLPPLIELSHGGYPIIYGAVSLDAIGSQISVGDVNGDGLADIVASHEGGNGSIPTRTQAGRIWIVFGRTNWSATLDLATDYNVLIYGKSKEDALGSITEIGDLNQDGTNDLIASAPYADGPNDQRSEAGDLYVFKGRTNWPRTIDLFNTNASLAIYGADAGDWTGLGGSFPVGDVDGDGVTDLTCGIRRGDGPAGNRLDVGEFRRIEPGSSWPLSIDLRSTYETVGYYGNDVSDEMCGQLRVADVNGDGQPDVICSATDADGPGNTRTNAGELWVSFGRSPMAPLLDATAGDGDWLIYGAQESDAIESYDTTDINGDGIAEIIVGESVYHASRIPSVRLISPIDIDGDGKYQLEDNCPFVSNADQIDTNGDGRGDTCATDWDGDQVFDTLDCAISDPRAGKPPEIAGVRFEAGSKTRLIWTSLVIADRYDLVRGDVTALSLGSYGSCVTSQDGNPADTVFDDATVPQPGSGLQYLVRGVDLKCGGSGTWGNASNGQVRSAFSPGCP